MNMLSLPPGVFPTMITPFTENNTIDYVAVTKMLKWYEDRGCQGVFAICQSSELFHLSLNERIELVTHIRVVINEIAAAKNADPMTLLASGHIADNIDDQVKELKAMYDAGADAVILITNRMNIANTNDDDWITDCEELISRLPAELPLGLYECPTPYKRLLSEKMIRWAADSKRFYFLKDTCCDADLIEKRIKWIEGSTMRLYNANAQTLLPSMRSGGSGYSGIMANFHPELYVWLIDHFTESDKQVEYAASLLSMMAFTEALLYPSTAKSYLNDHEDIKMTTVSRSVDHLKMSAYDTLVLSQVNILSRALNNELQLVISEDVK